MNLIHAKNKVSLLIKITNKILKKKFFERHSTLVAPDLIGCKLIRQFDNKYSITGIIVETEAYSQEEASCHGHLMKTKRNSPLFGEPGSLYIYKSYGIHHCLNIVTSKNSFASGVLIRSVEIENNNERCASGPGLVTRIFQIGLEFNSLEIANNNYLKIYDCGLNFNNSDLVNTFRIGINKAQDLKWRWYLRNSRSISKREKGDKTPKKSCLFSKYTQK